MRNSVFILNQSTTYGETFQYPLAAKSGLPFQAHHAPPRLPLESVTPIAEKPPSSLFRRSYLLTTCLICSVLAKSNSHAIIIDINVFNPLSLVANLGQQPL